MPVYNEAATVAEIVEVVLAQRPVRQLVIVDDCSGTALEPPRASGAYEPRIKAHPARDE